jgi:hypothetical protein
MSDEAVETMRLRELGGCITRAKGVYVYVPFAQTPSDTEGQPDDVHGFYLQISKDKARMVIDEARGLELEEVTARWDGGIGRDLLIG